jgi:hypothetical protein
MECRHVWSVPDAMVDAGPMSIATCLRCRETRSLEELLREGMESARRELFCEGCMVERGWHWPGYLVRECWMEEAPCSRCLREKPVAPWALYRKD